MIVGVAKELGRLGDPVTLFIDVIRPVLKNSGRVSCRTKIARPVRKSAQTNLQGVSKRKAHLYGFPTLGREVQEAFRGMVPAVSLAVGWYEAQGPIDFATRQT